MLRKLAPYLLTLLSVLLDTSVIHVLYHGVFLVPLSLVTVIMVGILLGRTKGVLVGLIAGLILDVSTGTLGLKLFPYIAIGFMMGFMVGPQEHISENGERTRVIRGLRTRITWVVVFTAMYELIMLFYQYFSTAVFQWGFVRNLLIRLAVVTLLTVVLYAPLRRIYIGKPGSEYTGKQKTREVKSF